LVHRWGVLVTVMLVGLPSLGVRVVRTRRQERRSALREQASLL
jgi:hypothetical protein